MTFRGQRERDITVKKVAKFSLIQYRELSNSLTRVCVLPIEVYIFPLPKFALSLALCLLCCANDIITEFQTGSENVVGPRGSDTVEPPIMDSQKNRKKILSLKDTL